jgi:hypothetical protein
MTAHGFKGMAPTRLNEMGCWNPDAIERKLAHQESDDVRRAYMHAAEYWPERVKMMHAWADYLDELRATRRAFPFAADTRLRGGTTRLSRIDSICWDQSISALAECEMRGGQTRQATG